MPEYSDSTRKLFLKSKNSRIKALGKDAVDNTPYYLKDYSSPVPVAKKTSEQGYLEIDINSTTVILMAGPSGSGKTTGDMSISTRTYKRDRLLANFADTDLHTLNLDNHGGVSKGLKDLMGFYDGEERHEIKQKTVLPKYLWNKMPEDMKPSRNTVELFSLGFQDVTDSELKFLLGQGLDRNQLEAMQSVLNMVSIDEDLKFDDLRDACEENEDIHHSTASKLKRNINVLDNSEVISPRFRKDVVSYLDNGYSLGVGMKGFSLLDSSDYYLMEFLSKKCFEKVVNARKNGVLDKSVFSIFPEAHHLMPKGGDSLLAEYLKRVFTYHQRRADVPAILDTQLPSQIDERLLEEVNHVFIGCDKNGKSLPKSEWSKVLRMLNVVSNPQRDNRRWMEKIQRLGHRDFLYVNASMTDPGDAPIVRFLAPMTSNP